MISVEVDFARNAFLDFGFGGCTVAVIFNFDNFLAIVIIEVIGDSLLGFAVCGNAVDGFNTLVIELTIRIFFIDDVAFDG